MLSLALLSFFGITEFLGWDEKTLAQTPCSNPSFFVMRVENGRTGDQAYVLKGTLQTPQPGFTYQFAFLNAQAPQVYAVLSAGQPVQMNNNGTQKFGRGLPAVTPLQVEQSFTLPQGVGLLRVRVDGLSAQPFEFGCDIGSLTPPA
jgi:hypothetical protein